MRRLRAETAILTCGNQREGHEDARSGIVKLVAARASTPTEKVAAAIAEIFGL